LEQGEDDMTIKQRLKYDKLLEEFIREEEDKSRMGSGDDEFFANQIRDYVLKQRKFWIDFIRFIEKRIMIT